jgi:hypothetical protein
MAHDILIVGIQLIAILTGVLMSRSNIRGLRRGLGVAFDRIDSRFDRIDATLADLNALTGKLMGRVEIIEKRH